VTRRELSPLGLVVHLGAGTWPQYDHGRDDLRTFRVDRTRRPAVAREPAVDPPEGFDAVTYISRSSRGRRGAIEVVVLLHLPLEEATRRSPATLASWSEAAGGTRLRRA
jgi:predicted DNA-binding transcriptional regulator YafY